MDSSEDKINAIRVKYTFAPRYLGRQTTGTILYFQGLYALVKTIFQQDRVTGYRGCCELVEGKELEEVETFISFLENHADAPIFDRTYAPNPEKKEFTASRENPKFERTVVSRDFVDKVKSIHSKGVQIRQDAGQAAISLEGILNIDFVALGMGIMPPQ